MQRLRRLLSQACSRDRAPPPTAPEVRAQLVAKLTAGGCRVVEGAEAARAVSDAQQQAMVAALEESATPRAGLRNSLNGVVAPRCHVPQLNIYVMHMDADAPDVDGAVRMIASSWRHGREIMTPEVQPSPSREHFVLTYRCVVTPFGVTDDGANE